MNNDEADERTLIEVVGAHGGAADSDRVILRQRAREQNVGQRGAQRRGGGAASHLTQLSLHHTTHSCSDCTTLYRHLYDTPALFVCLTTLQRLYHTTATHSSSICTILFFLHQIFTPSTLHYTSGPSALHFCTLCITLLHPLHYTSSRVNHTSAPRALNRCTVCSAVMHLPLTTAQ